ncbi:MAG: hypothetical protein PVG82_06925, partial [Chromatiales bacterium]|jgi:transcription-repair coupling factor (superfamily II helicase)
VLFIERPRVDPASVIRLVQSEPQVYRLDGGDRLRFHRDLPTLTERVDVVSALLDSLQLSDAA